MGLFYTTKEKKRTTKLEEKNAAIQAFNYHLKVGFVDSNGHIYAVPPQHPLQNKFVPLIVDGGVASNLLRQNIKYALFTLPNDASLSPSMSLIKRSVSVVTQFERICQTI